MWRIALLSVCLSVLLIAGVERPARAQSAVACMCYCGITISPPCSEQACKAACGWRGDDGGSGDGGTRGSSQIWYCRAVAPNGAWGWAYSPNRGWASSQALKECRNGGRGCAIEACRINDPSLAKAPSGKRQNPPGQSRPKAAKGWCDLCTRKLKNDVNAGWASGLVRLYVGQAIAGYDNCKRRQPGSCAAGDQVVKRLRACSSKMFDQYRSCLSDAIR